MSLTTALKSQTVFEPLIETITKFSNPELLRAQNWYGEKAFIAVNENGLCSIVVLSFIDRIKRFFRNERFANTLPQHLAQFLKDKDINRLSELAKNKDNPNPNLEAAAFRIKRLCNKWLTADQHLKSIVRIARSNIPWDLWWHLKFPRLHFWMIERENVSQRPNGRIIHEIKSYFVDRYYKGNIPNKEELQLWERLIEALKRIGWDISGDRIGSHFCGSALDEMHPDMMNNAPWMVNLFLNCDMNPFTTFTGAPSAYQYLVGQRPNARRLVDYYKEKNLDLKPLIRMAAYFGMADLMELYMREANTKISISNLCTYADSNMYQQLPRNPKAIMHLLDSVEQFTKEKGPEGKTALESHNDAVQRYNKHFANSEFKPLTEEDIQTMFDESRIKSDQEA